MRRGLVAFPGASYESRNLNRGLPLGAGAFKGMALARIGGVSSLSLDDRGKRNPLVSRHIVERERERARERERERERERLAR